MIHHIKRTDPLNLKEILKTKNYCLLLIPLFWNTLYSIWSMSRLFKLFSPGVAFSMLARQLYFLPFEESGLLSLLIQSEFECMLLHKTW